MASESSEGARISVEVPPPLEEWLSRQAERSGVEREEVLVGLLGAFREATEEGNSDVEALVDGRVGPLVDQRLRQFDEDLERKLDDIRHRVVQLKKEVDGKVAEDRFESLAEQVDELGEQVRELDEALWGLDTETLSDHEDRLDELEASLQTRTETAVKLDDRLDDVESKLTRVARVVVALRKEREESSGAGTDRTETDGVPELRTSPDETLLEIKRQAAREGITSAACGACGETVELSVLPESACPHCGAAFGGLDGRGGMFSSPRLVGERGETDA